MAPRLADIALSNDTLITVFTGLAAAGTLLAVFVALFGNPLRWPRVSLRDFDPQSADLALVYSSLDAAPSAWLRLRVVNRAGAAPARDASVTLLGVAPLAPSTPHLRRLAEQHWPPLAEDHERLLSGHALKWAERPIDKLDLPGGAEYLIDVAHLHGRPGEQHLRMTIFEHERYGIHYRRRARRPGRWFADRELAPRGRPDYRHFLYSPHYILGLVVLSRDTKPAFYTVELSGTRPGHARSEIWRHLTLTNLKAHKSWPPPSWPPST